MAALTSRRVRVAAVVAGLALALCLLGCDSGPRGEPVQLLIGVNGCYAGGEQGVKSRLVADPVYGARFNGLPVLWPEGFTGARMGGEVQILDGAGKVIATTGREYYISYAPVSAEGDRLMKTIGGYPAAANCGYPWDLIDCTAVAAVGAAVGQCKARLP